MKNKKGNLDTTVNEILLNYSKAPEELIAKARAINSLSFTYDEYFMPTKNGNEILTMYGAGFDDNDVKILDYKLVFELSKSKEDKKIHHQVVSGIVQFYDFKTTRIKWP